MLWKLRPRKINNHHNYYNYTKRIFQYTWKMKIPNKDTFSRIFSGFALPSPVYQSLPPHHLIPEWQLSPPLLRFIEVGWHKVISEPFILWFHARPWIEPSPHRWSPQESSPSLLSTGSGAIWKKTLPHLPSSYRICFECPILRNHESISSLLHKQQLSIPMIHNIWLFPVTH